MGELVVLSDGSSTRVSCCGIAPATDVSFVQSAWEQHLAWYTGRLIGSDQLPVINEVRGGHLLLQES